MERTISPADMKQTETEWMAATGTPGILLMEYAAQGVVRAMRALMQPPATALFVCGPGNNGGDGYAAARLWQEAGGRSILLECTAEARGDAAVNRRLALNAGIPASIPDGTETALPPCDLIVDALFGTGFSRAPEGIPALLIRLMNESGKPIVAVDIPSGLDGMSGSVPGEAVRAAVTVTFHRIKHGLILGDAAAYTGEITLCPILMPRDAGPEEGYLCAEPGDLRLIAPRPVNAHKGDFGRVVIFAGSPGMAGAAAFCAKACVKAGAGLTTLLVRASILPVVQLLAPEATAIPLPESEGRLRPEAQPLVEAQLRQADAAVIGCGLGRSADVYPLLALFREAACPVVWDADALNLLAEESLSGAPKPLPANACLTPHAGEAARLLGCTAAQVRENPAAVIGALQASYGCHVLLKGARTLMTDGRSSAVNRFGTPALAKGGSGDVLAGILAALLARRDSDLSVLTRMQLAALIHGLAGLRAADACGENGLTPQALIDAIRTDG